MRPLILITCAALSFGLPPAKAQEAKTSSTVTAMAEGRKITAVSTTPVSIKTSGGSASVTIGEHVLEIGRDKLQLDDGAPSILPATAKHVEITVEEEMMTVRAEGKEVLRAKMHKNE